MFCFDSTKLHLLPLTFNVPIMCRLVQRVHASWQFYEQNDVDRSMYTINAALVYI